MLSQTKECRQAVKMSSLNCLRMSELKVITSGEFKEIYFSSRCVEVMDFYRVFHTGGAEESLWFGALKPKQSKESLEQPWEPLPE